MPVISKHKWAFILLILAGMSVFLLSCGTGTKTGKPRSTGTTSEILIVTDSKEIWNGTVGDTIRKWFSQPIPALPQPEQMFDMLNVSKENFNTLFKKYHNILIVELDSGFTGNPSSQTTKDVWSEPQQVITLKARDKDEFLKVFREKRAGYLSLFNQLERQRIEVLNRMSGDIGLSRKVTDKFNLFLSIPGGFYLAAEGPGFMWLRHKVVKGKQDIELGIMIYFTEYKDTAQLNPQYILNWRNLQTRQYIPGPSEGSYMTISSDYIPPFISYPTDFPIGYALEIKGLWKVVNDFMGGSFMNYSFVDQKRNRLVSLDGYVYNPNEFKRNYLRQLESIFYTLKLTE